jgi:hypothetical protein
MTLHAKRPPAGGADGPLELSSYGGVDASESAPKIAPAQENLLLETIQALSAAEICAGTRENIPLMLAASGWRSTAALLMHAAGCADAGDLLNAERKRRLARKLFIEGNDAFHQFMEARAAAASAIGAEAFL